MKELQWYFDVLKVFGIQYMYMIQWRMKKSSKSISKSARYYASGSMWDPKLQKKVIDYASEKATPQAIIHKVGSEALNQLSSNVRPDYKYKTDRPDLDGGAIDFSRMYPMELYSDTNNPTNPLYKRCYGSDIQKQLAKLGELHMRLSTEEKNTIIIIIVALVQK